MIKKVTAILLMAFLMVPTLAVSANTNTLNARTGYHQHRVPANSPLVAEVLRAVENQTFANMTSRQARDYIAHFINSTARYTKVRNTNSFSNRATDGTYTVTIGSASAGCMHYARFISAVMHGLSNDARRARPEKVNGSFTAGGLRVFFQTEGQAGERMRFVGTSSLSPHSMAFVAATNDGIYFLEYEGNDTNPYLAYASYSHFAALMNRRGDDFHLTNQDISKNTAGGGVKDLADTVYYITNDDAPVRGNYYKTGTVLRRLPVGTAVTVNGSITNSQGNLWYRVKGVTGISGTAWIYSGNVSLANPNATLFITRDDAPVRDNYYATGNVLKRLPIGTEVVIGASAVNSHGNLWYSVSGIPGVTGTAWVYSGNLSNEGPRRVFVAISGGSPVNTPVYTMPQTNSPSTIRTHLAPGTIVTIKSIVTCPSGVAFGKLADRDGYIAMSRLADYIEPTWIPLPANRQSYTTSGADIKVFAEPSSYSSELRVVSARGTRVTVVATTVNAAGNVWGKLSDGGCIALGSLAAVGHPSCSSHTFNNNGVCTRCGLEFLLNVKDMAPTTMFVSNADTPVRNRPYASDTVIRRLERGASVTAVGSAVNSIGNVWYKLNDGTWIYSGNLSLRR
jgi:hypothetical protein